MQKVQVMHVNEVHQRWVIIIPTENAFVMPNGICMQTDLFCGLKNQNAQRLCSGIFCPLVSVGTEAWVQSPVSISAAVWAMDEESLRTKTHVPAHCGTVTQTEGLVLASQC